MTLSILLISSSIRIRTSSFIYSKASKLFTTLTTTNTCVSHFIDNKLCHEVEVYLNSTIKVKILEASAATQEEFVNKALESHDSGAEEDPYGIVCWPASVALSNHLIMKDLHNETICELGSGVGLVSLTLGLYSNVKSVYATDYNEFTVELLRKAYEIQHKSLDKKLEFGIFDLTDTKSDLPEASMYVYADVLYNPKLGRVVAKRIAEAVNRNKTVILGDSPGRVGRPYMLQELKEKFPQVEYKEVTMKQSISHGYRHNLISSSSDIDDVIDVTIYEFFNKNRSTI